MRTFNRVSRKTFKLLTAAGIIFASGLIVLQFRPFSLVRSHAAPLPGANGATPAASLAPTPPLGWNSR